MRIAVVHNHPSGGAARAIHELGKQLARSHTVHAYTLSSSDESFVSSRDYASAIRIVPFEMSTPRRLNFYLNDVRRYRDLNTLEYVYREVAAEIDLRRYDAVLVSACRYVQAPSVLRYLRTPSIYYCHEPPRRFLQSECRLDAGPLRPYERLRALLHRPADAILDRSIAARDRRNVAAATQVLTNSAHTARLAVRYYEREAQVSRLGVDADRFRPGRERGGYVLSVGALEYHKGFHFLVDALAAIPRDRRPELLIVANHVNPGVLSDLLRRASARSVALEIRERVTDMELAECYARAAAFVYAPHQEPFGLAVLEAMASGLPVVAVDEGGVAESVHDGETGFLTPRDAETFGSRLADLLASPALMTSFGMEARRVVEAEWTWAAAAARLEQALRETARAGRPTGVPATP